MSRGFESRLVLRSAADPALRRFRFGPADVYIGTSRFLDAFLLVLVLSCSYTVVNPDSSLEVDDRHGQREKPRLRPWRFHL